MALVSTCTLHMVWTSEVGGKSNHNQTEPVSWRLRGVAEGRRHIGLCLLDQPAETAKLSQADHRGRFCRGLSWSQKARTPKQWEPVRKLSQRSSPRHPQMRVDPHIWGRTRGSYFHSLLCFLVMLLSSEFSAISLSDNG